MFGQRQFHFEHYGTRDGLASEFATSLAQDSMGYIWIQYYGGVSRFDGYNFKVYRHNARDPLTSQLDFILGPLWIDDATNVWVTENFGAVSATTLAKHDRKTDGFIKYEIDLNAVKNRPLFERSGKVIWLGMDGGGLVNYNFETNEIKTYTNHLHNRHISKRQNIITDLKTLGASLLLTTEDGLWVFDKQSKSFKRPTCSSADSSFLYHTSFDRILDSPHVKEKNTWLRQSSGLVMLDSNLTVVKRFDFPSDIVMNGSAREASGVFWFVPADGKALYRYDPKDDSFISLVSDAKNENNFALENVTDVMVDKDQNVWVSTHHGINVLRYKHLKFYNRKIGSLWGNCIYKAKDADYIIASSDKSVFMSRLTPDRLDLLEFRRVPIPEMNDGLVGFCKGRNTFWISSGSSIAGYRIDHRNGLFGFKPQITLNHKPENPYSIRSGYVQTMWEDENEDLWVGYLYPRGLDQVRRHIQYGTKGSVVRHDFGGGINGLFHPKNKNSFWICYDKYLELVELKPAIEMPARKQVAAPNELTYAMLKTSDGNIILGTNNNVYELTEVDGEYSFNDTPILSNFEVNSMVEDTLDRLWLYGGNKLLCHDRREGYTAVFDERDGIDHFRSANLSWMHEASSGVIVLASVDGITAFDPTEFQPSRTKTNPVLTALTVNNVPTVGRTLKNDTGFSVRSDISVLDELVVDYRHNDFSIEFSAIEMTAPEKNRYKHKLEGYDNNWIESDSRTRTATYANLDAGEYIFKVRASNHHGIWSDNERVLKVTVLPPPWKTTWAYIGYIMLIIGLLYAARRNIVQRERLQSNFRLAKVEQEKEHYELEKAREVYKLKSTFFTNISHEFRTPLTLIKGPVQHLLEKFNDHDNVKAQLKLIERNSDLLLRLINQLLDLARLESGNLTVEPVSVELSSFLSATIRSFLPLALQKNINLNLAMGAAGYVVLVDKHKLETILVNLISNAIKFTTTNGTINVNTQVTAGSIEAPLKGNLIISISDNGIGIAADQQDKIFERFYQVTESHHEVGTGIGLSLVKELITLMEGTITVSSEPKKGSEFTVSIPTELLSTEASESISLHPSDQFQPPHSLNGVATILHSEETTDSTMPCVLIVEDNSDLQEFIMDSLGHGYSYRQAGDGKQGMDVAIETTPDIIISDVMMPTMDGITMAGELKKDPRTSHIPIILLTARTSDESKLCGLATGADDYITKPFNRTELLLKVRNMIEARAKLRERLRISLLQETPKIEIQSADEQFLEKVKATILSRLGDEQLGVESLAEEVALSRSQLFRKVNALTGLSVSALIRTFRLQRAAQLLEKQWGTVSQIAFEVGFASPSYFSRVFKQHYGVMPSEYIPDRKSLEFKAKK